MIHRVVFNSSTADSFDDCLTDCLHSIHQQTKTNALLGVTFFVNAIDSDAYHTTYRTICTAIENRGWMFPFNVLAQPGCCPICIEMWIDNPDSKTEYLMHNGYRYTRHHSETGTSIWGMGLHHRKFTASINEQAEETFSILYELLRNEGMSLSDIVRQWNYVPGILKTEFTGGKLIQHYQAFNEIRKSWYAKTLFAEGYPAATGIGVKTGPFSIDFIAIKSDSFVEKIGLCNPKQENAYQYAQQHLIGDTLNGKHKNPPLFERAKLLNFPNDSIVIVSGTAAILGQETVGLGDVDKQTEVAINNMLELIAPAVTKQDKAFRFNFLRVYVKDPTNLDVVRVICESKFPGIPVSYVQADVCRDNLLMEIEGEAFA